MLRGFSRTAGFLSAVACVLAMASSAGAVTLTFEGQGLSNLEEVGTVYDTPEFGNVTFSAGTIAYKGDTFFSGEPSQDTVISAVASTPVDLSGRVQAGFTGEFSLWYSSASNGSATIQLFDIDGNPIVGASLTLPATGDGGDLNRVFDNWCEVGGGCSPVATTVVSSLAVPDGQIAYSFRLFDPSGLGIAFDSITFTPVPEPSTAMLLGLGVVSLAVGGRRTRSASL